MTDHEYKIDIMRRTFIKASIESGMDEEFAKETVEQVLSEKAFIDSIMSCMEQWAGFISARTDESNDFERACIAASHYLSNDIEEIPEIIRTLQDIEDDQILLDDAIPNIIVWEKLESSFTVAEFLDAIGL